jgi:hypothetical protein
MKAEPADRDMIALALAKLALERPGWENAIIEGVGKRQHIRAQIIQHMAIIRIAAMDALHPGLATHVPYDACGNCRADGENGSCGLGLDSCKWI